MIDGLVELAKWATTTDNAVAWLLALNLGSLFTLIFWLTRYQPKLLRLIRTLQSEQRARDEAMITALHASTEAMASLAQILQASASGQVGRPILWTLDGVATKVDEILRGMQTLLSDQKEALERLERIEHQE